MGVYVIAVLSFFPSGISVILILMCGIGVSSSPAAYGFFILPAINILYTVFGKRRSFTVLQCRSYAFSSCLMHWSIFRKLNLDLRVKILQLFCDG